MNSEIILKTGNPRTTAPIIVEVAGKALASENTLQVSPLEKQSDAFQVELKPMGENYLGEFVLFLPGKYELKTGSLARIIQVEPQKDIPFLTEMAVFLPLVIITLVGVIRWAKKKKQYLL